MSGKFSSFVILLFTASTLFGEIDSFRIAKDYRFIIMDSPANLFTMRQFDINYLSAYRLIFRGMNNAVKNEKIVEVVQAAAQLFFFIPLTHEEGHRSILTANNIGSISQPYFNSKGAAYVKGVTDRELRHLRDNDLPTYIRLHTAGIESDYMLTKHAEMIGCFGLDDFKIYRWEYWVRKFAIVQYYFTGVFGYDIDIKEESNELERDIVGYDTYGAVRHLFRPAMEFYRYTRYDELTTEEKRFIKRTGWCSLLNLANPLIVGKENFTIGKNTRLNFGLGYTMAPFGDFIDENMWIKYRAFNIAAYTRQFHNRSKWFYGGGVSLYDYRPIDRLSIDVSAHIWQQPEELDFNTSESFIGGAIEFDIGFFLLDRNKTPLRGFSLDLGFIYKTKGFLPEEVRMNDHLGFRIGATFRN